MLRETGQAAPRQGGGEDGLPPLTMRLYPPGRLPGLRAAGDLLRGTSSADGCHSPAGCLSRRLCHNMLWPSARPHCLRALPVKASASPAREGSLGPRPFSTKLRLFDSLACPSCSARQPDRADLGLHHLPAPPSVQALRYRRDVPAPGQRRRMPGLRIQDVLF